jgi:hypothetical protein
MARTIKSGKRRRSGSESGVALLIAIFVVMLVSVVGISLLVSSGTESALNGNYRSSASVYQAALAGLEEARGRLFSKNSGSFTANFMPPLAVGEVRYLVNPINGENVLATYPDTQYLAEFGVSAPASPQTAASVWANNTEGIPTPAYKWVRINAITERSLGADVDGDGDRDSSTALFYDYSALDAQGKIKGGLILSPNPRNPTVQVQALEITSLAVLPNGSQKLLQYVVAPMAYPSIVPVPRFNFDLPSALTLDGEVVRFESPAFKIDGTDHNVGTCPAGPAKWPVGYTVSLPQNPGKGEGEHEDSDSIKAHNVRSLLTPKLLTVNGLNELVRAVQQGADAAITPKASSPADGKDLPSGMSPTNPMTVVVNGDLDLSAWHGTGYGILLVTGDLKYGPDATWNGVVLVIGKGSMSGNGLINGAVLVARTVDSSGASVRFSSGSEGGGIYYSSCLIKSAINNAQAPLPYKVLSFREIPQ